MKVSKIGIIFLIPAFLLVSCGPKAELVGSVPGELEGNLVSQEGHIPYYFPSGEELGDLKDGMYTGSLSGGMIDRGEVAVTIGSGRISDVEIIDITFMAPSVRREGRVDEVYAGLPEQVLENQSPQVDSVSGATGTTHVFKICVTRALWQAAGKSDPMEPYSPY